MKIRHILLRDLRILLSDKKTLATILLMPIILTSILSFALADVFGDDPVIPNFQVSVVKEYEYIKPEMALKTAFDGNLLGSLMPEDMIKELSESATETDVEKIFFEEFLQHEDIRSMMTYSVDSLELAKEKLNNNETSAIIVLPENFLISSYTNMFTTYHSVLEIEVIRNPERSITPSIAISIVEGYLNRMSASNIRKNIAVETFIGQAGIANNETVISDAISETIETSTNQSLEITFNEETTTGKQGITSRSYYSVSMLTLFLLFSAGRGSYMLLEEKREFTYQRLLTAGVSKWRILSGKFFVIFSIVILQLITLIFYSTFVLGVYWGNGVDLAIVSIFTAFGVAGLGSLLGVITFVSDKTRIAGLFESVIFQVMGLIGGAYIPIEVLPSEIQALSRIPLNGVALKAYLNIMTGSTATQLTDQLILLFLNGVVFVGLAVYLMGRKGETKHVSSNQTQIVGA